MVDVLSSELAARFEKLSKCFQMTVILNQSLVSKFITLPSLGEDVITRFQDEIEYTALSTG